MASFRHSFDSPSFPNPVIDVCSLKWVSVANSDGTSPQNVLGLEINNGNSSPTMVEGFGYELLGQVLTLRNTSRGQEIVRAPDMQARILVIPDHVVKMEQRLMRSQRRMSSDLLKPGFSEVRLSQRHVEAAKFGSSHVFIGDIGRPYVSAQFGIVRVTVQEGESGPSELVETQALFLDNPSMCIGLPSRPSIGRVLRNALYGEVRDGLILDFNDRILSPEGVPRTQYLRPAVDMNGKYTADRLVATKVILKSRLPGGEEYTGHLSDDPLKEIAAMRFIRNRLDELIEQSVGLEHDLLVESQQHVIKLIASVQDSARIYIIMQLINGGELFDVFETFTGENQNRSKELFRQVCLGVFALHRCGVAHRDISLENVLLDVDTRLGRESCLIIDLGLCHRVEGLVMNSRKGKTYYLPYENMDNSVTRIDAFACDMWALGVMLFIMLTANAPFDTTRKPMQMKWYSDLASGVLGGKLVRFVAVGGAEATVIPLHQAVQPEAMELILRLLHVDFRSRMTIGELLQHPWLHAERDVSDAMN